MQEVLLITKTSLQSLAIFLIAMTKTTWKKAYLGFQFEERASFTLGNSWPQKHVAAARIHRIGQVGLDSKPSRPPLLQQCLTSRFHNLVKHSHQLVFECSKTRVCGGSFHLQKQLVDHNIPNYSNHEVIFISVMTSDGVDYVYTSLTLGEYLFKLFSY